MQTLIIILFIWALVGFTECFAIINNCREWNSWQIALWIGPIGCLVLAIGGIILVSTLMYCVVVSFVHKQIMKCFTSQTNNVKYYLRAFPNA